MRVRLAEFGDVDAIVSFGATVIPAHYEPILGTVGARAQLAWWTQAGIAAAVDARRVHVAEVDRDIVGVAQTGSFSGDEVIWKLYLESGFRGRPLGAHLLQHAVAALPADTDHVLVEHFAGNTRAGRFYEREGFVVVRVEPASSGNPGAAVVWRRLEL
jgi:ribosomal protein S18 acetylase RimI-like enzyme